MILSLICGLAHADQLQEFVRIACIPEARELRIDYVTFDAGNAFSGVTTPAEGKARERAWARNGFFEPDHLTKTCELASATYRVVTTQGAPRATGLCGASPTIYFSLFQGKERLLNQVALGDACGNLPNVRSVDVFDGREGWASWTWSVCVSPQGDAPARCTDPVTPVAQEDLANLAIPPSQ
jgi:hypothetical protein